MKYLIIFLLIPVFASSQITVKEVIQCEYRVWYRYSDNHIHGYSNNGGTFIKQYQEPSGHQWGMIHGSFNYMDLLDTNGYVWQSKPFNQDTKDSFWRVDVDTTGSAFSGNIFINSYSQAHMTLASDSTPYYFGIDVFNFFYTGGSLVTSAGTRMLPTQFSTLKLKKIVMGYSHIVGLSSNGLTVYEWLPGNRTPHQTLSLSRPATDIFVAQSDFWGYLMPDATGSQSMGYPYVAGTSTSLYGGGSSNSTPASIKSLWGLTQPIKVFDVDWQAIHFIDSSGHLWGCGWNTFGEVGNGVEFVNRYTYGGYPNAGWSFNNGENPTGIPVKIGDTTKNNWVAIYSNNWYGTTKYARDANDSIYSRGRNKGNVMGNGYAMNIWTPDGSNVDQYHYNTVDILIPTLVTPISQRTQVYNATPATITIANQSIRTPYTTITPSGNMLRVFATSQPAANGVDTIGYSIISHNWTKKSGPSKGAVANAASTVAVITNMVNGTYVWQDLISDNHSGQDTVQSQVVVNGVNLLNRIAGGRIKWH